MIVKASDTLRLAVFMVPPSEPQSFSQRFTELSQLNSMMPDWLKEALQINSVVIMQRQDFYDLDTEIRDHLEVMTR